MAKQTFSSKNLGPKVSVFYRRFGLHGDPIRCRGVGNLRRRWKVLPMSLTASIEATLESLRRYIDAF